MLSQSHSPQNQSETRSVASTTRLVESHPSGKDSPNHIVSEPAMQTTTSNSAETPAGVPATPPTSDERAMMRKLSAIQVYLLQRIASTGTTSWAFEAARAYHAHGTDKALKALEERRLIKQVGPVHYQLTPDGQRLIGLIPPLGERIRANSRYLRILQNAYFHSKGDRVLWLIPELLIDGVSARGKHGRQRLLNSLWAIGLLEREAFGTGWSAGHGWRLSATGWEWAAAYLFDEDERAVLARYRQFSLEFPADFMPKSKRVKASAIKTLVKRGLIEQHPDGSAAYRITDLARRLASPDLPPEPTEPTRPLDAEIMAIIRRKLNGTATRVWQDGDTVVVYRRVDWPGTRYGDRSFAEDLAACIRLMMPNTRTVSTQLHNPVVRGRRVRPRYVEVRFEVAYLPGTAPQPEPVVQPDDDPEPAHTAAPTWDALPVEVQVAMLILASEPTDWHRLDGVAARDQHAMTGAQPPLAFERAGYGFRITAAGLDLVEAARAAQDVVTPGGDPLALAVVAAGSSEYVAAALEAAVS